MGGKLKAVEGGGEWEGGLSKITKGQLMGELVHPYNDFSFALSETESLGGTELRSDAVYLLS